MMRRRVQRPQIVTMGNGLVEVRVRVPVEWFSQLAVQARAEAATAGQLIQEAMESLLPPDGAVKGGPVPAVTPAPSYRTRTGTMSSLSAEQRSRAARGERIFSPEDLRRISEQAG